MPHKHSPEARLARRRRAFRLGFLRSSATGKRWIQVDSEVANAARVSARSLEFHAKHDLASGISHHFARNATWEARNHISSHERNLAMKTHQQAGALKHTIGEKAIKSCSRPAASCGVPDLVWADVDDHICGEDALADWHDVKTKDEFDPWRGSRLPPPSATTSSVECSWTGYRLLQRMDALERRVAVLEVVGSHGIASTPSAPPSDTASVKASASTTSSGTASTPCSSKRESSEKEKEKEDTPKVRMVFRCARCRYFIHGEDSCPWHPKVGGRYEVYTGKH